MYYYMQLNRMYVDKLSLSFKEWVELDNEKSQTTMTVVRVKSIEVSSGKSEAIKFNDVDETDRLVIKELETLGYEKEEVGASIATPWATSPWDEDLKIATKVGIADWNDEYEV